LDFYSYIRLSISKILINQILKLKRYEKKSELFKADTLKKEANPNLKIPAFLEKEGRNADYLVLWLDCDKEGENICFEVVDCVRNVMNRPGDSVS
jgi:DNA topoisomerase IA